MITPTAITGTDWTAITAAGQSGTLWLSESTNAKKILIYHTTSGTPNDTVMPDAYHMPLSRASILSITADSATDIYYARCLEEDGTATLVSDVK